MKELKSHWYYPDGKPAYELPNKSKGGTRGVTIKDARKLGLVPSVTTILKIVYSYSLESWKAEQIVKAAWDVVEIDPTRHNFNYEQWRDVVLDKASEISSEAADKGSEIHNAIDEHLTTGIVSGEYAEWQKTFAKWHTDKWSELDFGDISTEGYIKTDFGYGGRYDILIATQITQLISRKTIIDIKTQNAKGKPFKFYRSWGRQLAAYARPLRASRLINVVMDSQDPSRIESYEWQDKDELLAEFKACQLLWNSENNLHSKKESEAENE